MPNNVLMLHNVVICSSHHGICSATQGAIGSLVRRGYNALIDEGCADVALARNMALSRAMEKIRELEDVNEYVFLMVDDDMVFDATQADILCAQARMIQMPVSGIYATAGATVAATLLDPVTRRYLTGLGFLAIPVPRLLELESKSQSFRHGEGGPYTEYCWTGCADRCGASHQLPPALHDGWISEDYCLTLRLGGARLSRMSIGHMKTVPLYPDSLSCRRFGDQIPIADGEEPVPDTEREPSAPLN